VSTRAERSYDWPVRVLAIVVNLLLRSSIVAVLAEALRWPQDPRFAGKGIGTRGLVMLPASLLVPVVHAIRRRRDRYPIWTDNLFLSILALDLAGNHFGLYDRYRYFDAVPHAHGTGAATVVISELLDVSPLSGVGLAQLLHIGLEAQEYYSDVLFGLHNVRGTWDTVNDLLAGAVGSALYASIHWVLRGRRFGA
jgi:hypothetical protein